MRRSHFSICKCSSLLIAFGALTSALAAEKDRDTLLYAPLAGIHQNQAAFEPVLFKESTPISFSSYISDARGGGSGIAGNILFPLNPRQAEDKDKRVNGWALGAATGYQRDALAANDIFVPGFFFIEALAGRATTESWTVAGTGLRGYLEIAFRNQRPTRNIRQQDRLSLVNQTIPNDNYFFVVRMGAASDNEGSGIVSQKAGRLSWAVQSSLYAPLKKKQGYFNVKVSPYSACFSDSFNCGIHLQYMNIFKGTKQPNSEHINHFGMFSLFLKYTGSNALALSFEIFESFSASPILDAKKFNTQRNSYSVYPGAKFNFSIGF